MPLLALMLASALIGPAHAADPAALWAGLEDPSGWKEVGRKAFEGIGDIVVRHKNIQGQDCLEGTTTADLPPDALLAAAVDIPSQSRWSSFTLPAAVRLSAGPTSFDYYEVLDNPMPIADRVWFVRGEAVVQGDQHRFRWEQIDGDRLYPAAAAEVKRRFSGVVATTVNIGDWTFSPSGAGTRLRYRICTDAGGSIPGWVGEIAARQTLPTNLADIIREVRRRLGRK